MAITNITTANVTTDETSPIDCSIVITDDAGNNRKVVVFITQLGSPSNNSVVPTLNGVSGVLLRTRPEPSTLARCSLFEWNDANLPATSGTYTVSWAVNSVDAALSVLSCSGARQVSCACPTQNSGIDVGLNITYNLVAAAGSVAIIGMMDATNTAVLTPGANQVYILSPTSTGLAIHTAGYNVTNLTVSYTRLANNNCSSVAAAIEPYYDAPISWTTV